MSISRIVAPKDLHMFKAFDVHCQIALWESAVIYIPTNSAQMPPVSPNSGQLWVLSYF